MMATAVDDRSLIQLLLADDRGEYVYLPPANPPFGLLSVRCKRLVTGSP